MTATQERTATVIDRLGHTAPQGILPVPEFAHLADRTIELDPIPSATPTDRDNVLLSLYDFFELISKDFPGQEIDQIMFSTLAITASKARKDKAAGVTGRRLLQTFTGGLNDFKLLLFTDPQREGATVKIIRQEYQAVIDLAPNDASIKEASYWNDGFDWEETTSAQSFRDRTPDKILKDLSTIRDIDKEIFNIGLGEVRN